MVVVSALIHVGIITGRYIHVQYFGVYVHVPSNLLIVLSFFLYALWCSMYLIFHVPSIPQCIHGLPSNAKKSLG